MLTNAKPHLVKEFLTTLVKSMPPGDVAKVPILLLLQVFLTMLDIVGIALLSATIGLLISSGSFAQEGSRLASLLQILGLDEIGIRNQIIVLGLIAICLLVSKSIVSLFLSRKITFFYSSRSAVMSARLLEFSFTRPNFRIQKDSIQKTIFLVNDGVQSLFVRGYASATIFLTDSILLILYLTMFFIVDFWLALVIVIYFASIVTILMRFSLGPAKKYGKLWTELSISSNEAIQEISGSFRELFVSNTLNEKLVAFKERRSQLLEIYSKRVNQTFFTKYVMEVALLGGIFVMGAFQFATQSNQRAFLTLSVFTFSMMRVMPAILRMQQEFLNLRSTVSSTRESVRMILESGRDISADNLDLGIKKSEIEMTEFSPRIEMRNVSFQYGNNVNFTIKDINIDIEPGDFVALVGPSGAGKSTLMDLMIGVLHPISGLVRISGVEPSRAVLIWRGSVGYVPQTVGILHGSIYDNVLLGREFGEFDVEEALAMAGFEESLEWKHGIKTKIGPGGIKLSGGQRQRLGIARALLSNPKLIFMDEATSSLDSSSEQKILDSLSRIREGRTMVAIAHRLSTVRDANKLIYVDSGKSIATGTFDEVRRIVPEFNSQVLNLGIT